MKIILKVIFWALILAKPINPRPYCIEDCLENTCSNNCPLGLNTTCGACVQISALTFVKIDCSTEVMTVFSDSNCKNSQTTLTPRTCGVAYNVPINPNCTGNCTIALYADVFCNYPLTTFETTSSCKNFHDTQVVFQSLKYNCLTEKVDFYNEPDCVGFSFSKSSKSTCDILVTNQGPALTTACTHTVILPTIHYIEYDYCPTINAGSLYCARPTILIPLLYALFRNEMASLK